MKHHLAFLLLAATAFSPLSAQPAVPAPPVVDARVAALRDAALKDDLAWTIVEGLTTEVGPRLAGTEAEARARDWAVARLKSLGFANVRVEEFDLPVWTRGAEAAEILAPFPQRLVVAALGNSASTGVGGVQGEVVGFNSLAENCLCGADNVALVASMSVIGALGHSHQTAQHAHRVTRPLLINEPVTR
jgi:hypothetical protein